MSASSISIGNAPSRSCDDQIGFDLTKMPNVVNENDEGFANGATISKFGKIKGPRTQKPNKEVDQQTAGNFI